MTISDSPYRETDVLIIGGGLAGCAAALAAHKAGLSVVLTTCQGEFNESSSYYAQGGIIYKGEDDSFESLLEDFQQAGAGIVNERAVRQIYQFGPEFIEQIFIKELNVPFNRTFDGKIALTQEAVHSKPRIAYVQDYTGKAIQQLFFKKVQNLENVEILTKATAVDLITLAHHSLDLSHIYEPSTCAGAYVYFQKENEVRSILAKQTILATGGLGRLYLYTSNPHHARGDGYAMAYRAGARVMNMEYVQFHPTTLYSTSDERFLISEALRGEGAILRNQAGEDFMKKYHEAGSLAPRDVVARCIIQEMNETCAPYMYLDISHKNADWIKQRFPEIYKKCLEAKVDITREGIPVVPAAHFECGGVATDELGNTTIRRLKAVGEVACTGLHGANRLASSSLLECLVFGTLAGRDCAERIKQDVIIMPPIAKWKAEYESLDPDLLRQDRLTIQHTMWNYVGIIRSAKKLERAYGILYRLKQDIDKFYAYSQLNDDLIGLRNAALTAMLILHAATINKSSRGCHYRID